MFLFWVGCVFILRAFAGIFGDFSKDIKSCFFSEYKDFLWSDRFLLRRNIFSVYYFWHKGKKILVFGIQNENAYRLLVETKTVQSFSLDSFSFFENEMGFVKDVFLKNNLFWDSFYCVSLEPFEERKNFEVCSFESFEKQYPFFECEKISEKIARKISYSWCISFFVSSLFLFFGVFLITLGI